MKNEIIKDIVEYPVQLAASPKYGIILGHRLNSVDELDAKNIIGTMRKLIGVTYDQMFDFDDDEISEEEIEQGLIRSFMYCFDKTVELIYKTVVESDEEVIFNSNDLINGSGGDGIPEYLQLKITPMIGNITLIFDENYKYANQFIDQIDKKNRYHAILTGDIQLGIEVGLRLDVNDSSEMDKFLSY